VVDVVSAVSSTATIETKAPVYLANSQSLSMSSAASFRICDLLTCVLGYFSPLPKTLRGETSFTVNGGTLDC
jgi:hypothetical protein